MRFVASLWFEGKASALGLGEVFCIVTAWTVHGPGGLHKRKRVSCDFVMCLGDFAPGARFLSKGGGSKVIGSSE